jgi:hypothetical protein
VLALFQRSQQLPAGTSVGKAGALVVQRLCEHREVMLLTEQISHPFERVAPRLELPAPLVGARPLLSTHPHRALDTWSVEIELAADEGVVVAIG